MGQPVAFFQILSPDHERAETFYRVRSAGRWPPTRPRAGTAWSIPVPAKAPSGASARRRAGREGRQRSTYGPMTWTPAWTGPRSWAASRWSRPTDLPGDYRRFAVFTDPDGSHVGLWS